MRRYPCWLFGIGIFSLSAWGGIEYKRTRCDEPFLKTTWHDLIANERAIGEAFNKIVAHAGTPKVVNCVTEFPVDSETGKPVFGTRRAVLDSQWFETIIENGVEKKFFHQQGMKIEYLLAPPATGLPPKREVHALMICRTPDACRQMGIPY